MTINLSRAVRSIRDMMMTSSPRAERNEKRGEGENMRRRV